MSEMHSYLKQRQSRRQSEERRRTNNRNNNYSYRWLWLGCCILVVTIILWWSLQGREKDYVSLYSNSLVLQPQASSFGLQPLSYKYRQSWKEQQKRAWRQVTSHSRSGLEEHELLCQDPATRDLRVAGKVEDTTTTTTTTTHESYGPRILCVVLTTSSHHDTRLQTILQTWGWKCDGFLAASDQDDANYLYAFEIRGAAKGYWGIYNKLMLTYRQILQEKALQEFDWIFKADDDTYVIMENLRAFLESQQHSRLDMSQPHIFGRTMPWPRLAELKSFKGWFETPEAQGFRNRFFEKFTSQTQRLVYTHGGPGYLVNRRYMEMVVEAYFESHDAVKGPISEDMAQAFNMLYRHIRPHPTHDTHGREAFHPEPPRVMHEAPYWLPMMQESIQNVAAGMSPYSISFHHMKPRDMILLDYQLHNCQQTGLPT